MTPFPSRSHWLGKMLACLIAVALIGSNAWSAQPEVYPDRTIKMVSPHPAGVATDVLGRAIAPVLQQNFGQPVVLENRPGANGIVAEGAVARSTPDGYTILITSGAHIANAFVAKELPFDVIKDFAPVTRARSFIRSCPGDQSSRQFRRGIGRLGKTKSWRSHLRNERRWQHHARSRPAL